MKESPTVVLALALALCCRGFGSGLSFWLGSGMFGVSLGRVAFRREKSFLFSSNVSVLGHFSDCRLDSASKCLVVLGKLGSIRLDNSLDGSHKAYQLSA